MVKGPEKPGSCTLHISRPRREHDYPLNGCARVASRLVNPPSAASGVQHVAAVALVISHAYVTSKQLQRCNTNCRAQGDTYPTCTTSFACVPLLPPAKPCTVNRPAATGPPDAAGRAQSMGLCLRQYLHGPSSLSHSPPSSLAGYVPAARDPGSRSPAGPGLERSSTSSRGPQRAGKNHPARLSTSFAALCNARARLSP